MGKRTEQRKLISDPDDSEFNKTYYRNANSNYLIREHSIIYSYFQSHSREQVFSRTREVGVG